MSERTQPWLVLYVYRTDPPKLAMGCDAPPRLAARWLRQAADTLDRQAAAEEATGE